MKDNINQKLIQITQMLCEITNELITASTQNEHKPVPLYNRTRRVKSKPTIHGNVGKRRSDAHKEAIRNGMRKPFILTIKQPNGLEINLPFTGNAPMGQMADQLGITGRYVNKLKGDGYVVNRRRTTKHPYPDGSTIKLTYIQK